MTNPLLNRYAKGQHGGKSERRIAKRLGAKLSPGSGSKPGAKGDSALPDLLIESKATVRESIILKRSWLQKISREALDRNLYPALSLSFVSGSGESRPNGDWLLVPVYVARKAGLV
jgi:hypothetical protein